MRIGGVILKKQAIMLASVLALAACSGFGDREEGRPLDSLSPEELFTLAEFELEANGNPEEAARFFGEVERLYP